MKMKTIFAWLVGLARELSDEAAYRRYLERARCEHSSEAWRTFIDRRHRRKYQNAKCC
jgi:hypothetical protein